MSMEFWLESGSVPQTRHENLDGEERNTMKCDVFLDDDGDDGRCS